MPLGVCRKTDDNVGADLGRNFPDWAVSHVKETIRLPRIYFHLSIAMITKNLRKGRGWLIFCNFSLGRSLSLSLFTEENLFRRERSYSSHAQKRKRPDNRYALVIRARLSEIMGQELLMQLYRMPRFSVVKTMYFVRPL